MHEYVHGYSDKESCRLTDQADTLSELLHHDTIYPPGSRVLEAGCGTGAQTVFLAANSPEAHFTSIDISGESLEAAKSAASARDIENVTFRKADMFNLPFEEGAFDHIFICFVLEHLKDPEKALLNLGSALKPGGTITVIEGDHGSFYCHPESHEAQLAVNCLIDIQARMGGNSLIGRQLYPLLIKSGFNRVMVSPRMVYVDSGKPALVDGFSKKTFTAMVEGVREQALELGIIERDIFDRGIKDLYRATEEDGTFCYTFFKARATR